MTVHPSEAIIAEALEGARQILAAPVAARHVDALLVSLGGKHGKGSIRRESRDKNRKIKPRKLDLVDIYAARESLEALATRA